MWAFTKLTDLALARLDPLAFVRRQTRASLALVALSLATPTAKRLGLPTPLRWTAAGMMEAAKGFRRLKAYKHPARSQSCACSSSIQVRHPTGSMPTRVEGKSMPGAPPPGGRLDEASRRSNARTVGRPQTRERT